MKVASSLASAAMEERHSEVQDGAKRGVTIGRTMEPLGSMERM